MGNTVRTVPCIGLEEGQRMDRGFPVALALIV